MKTIAFISVSRLLSAFLLTCAFVLAPMAETFKAEADTHYSCEASYASVSMEDGTSDHSEDDHHSHACISCHLHVIRKDLPHPVPFITLQEIMHPRMATLALSTLPASIYRPPRS
jgi:hypothetical protein